MTAKVADLMSKRVITAQPHHTVGHIRTLMSKNRIQAVPVVNTDQEPVGIITSSDLVSNPKDGTPISKLMGDKVYTVPKYSGVHVAARIMRNHHIHHVVVTHEQEVAGMVSSFDLLRLVEKHRFVMKQGPTEKTKKNKRLKSPE